jgi:nucleotidyltransferase/DNA polymerase involved in DNA repair
MGKQILSEIKGIGPSKVKILNKANINTIEELAKKNPNELSKIEGVGYKSAIKWIAEAKRLLDGVQSHVNITSSLPTIEQLDNILKNVQSNISSLLKRVESIEYRLDIFEEMVPTESKETMKGQKLLESISDHPFIRNENILFEIMSEKVNEMTEKWLGIREVTIDDLYHQIIKDYSITKEIFVEYLLMLYQNEKIHMASGTMSNGFSVRDHDGKIYQVIRIKS